MLASGGRHGDSLVAVGWGCRRHTSLGRGCRGGKQGPSKSALLGPGQGCSSLSRSWRGWGGWGMSVSSWNWPVWLRRNDPPEENLGCAHTFSAAGNGEAPLTIS